MLTELARSMVKRGRWARQRHDPDVPDAGRHGTVWGTSLARSAAGDEVEVLEPFPSTPAEELTGEATQAPTPPGEGAR